MKKYKFFKKGIAITILPFSGKRVNLGDQNVKGIDNITDSEAEKLLSNPAKYGNWDKQILPIKQISSTKDDGE